MQRDEARPAQAVATLAWAMGNLAMAMWKPRAARVAVAKNGGDVVLHTTLHFQEASDRHPDARSGASMDECSAQEVQPPVNVIVAPRSGASMDECSAQEVQPPRCPPIGSFDGRVQRH